MEPTWEVIRAALSISILSSSLSVFGGLLIIGSYVTIPEIRNTVRRLLVCLTIADLVTAFGNFVGAVRYTVLQSFTQNITEFENDPVCVGQAFLTTFSNLSSFVWTILIALHLFLAVIFKRNLHFTHWLLVEILDHGFGWVLPGAIAITALAKGKLGEDGTYATGSWCWISKNIEPFHKQVEWMYITGKAGELITYLVTATLYILLKLFTRRMRRRNPDFEWSRTQQRLRKEDENFCYAWGIVYLLRLWGTLRFFMSFYPRRYFLQDTYPTLDSVFMCLQCYGASAQAFWNFILYCVCDETVRHAVLRRRGNYQELESSIEQS